MVTRFTGSLLVQPSLAPLFVVAAATRAGARQLDVEELAGRLLYRIQLAEPDLSGQPHLLSSGSARWLVLAMAAQGQACSLLCPEQGRKLSLQSGRCSLSTWTPGSADSDLTLEVSRPQSAPTLAPLLRRHCSLCPLPVRLQGELLQKDLTLAHRQAPVWSPEVAELFHPPGPAELDSPLAIFLAHSRAAQPTWVAVVGGISYPFQLPQAPGRVGVIWCDELRTDLSLGSVVQDEAWEGARREILRVCARG